MDDRVDDAEDDPIVAIAESVLIDTR